MNLFRNFFGKYIIARFLVIFVPVFLVFTLLALFAIADRHISNSEDLLAVRIGNQSGRISSLIGQVGIVENAQSVSRLTSTLLADPAISCVDVLQGNAAIRALGQPKNLGCGIMTPEKSVVVSVPNNTDLALRIGFNYGEIQKLKSDTLWLAIYTALFGSLGAVFIGVLGFSYSVIKPIRALKNVMESSKLHPDTRAKKNGDDEIGKLCLSFNALQDQVGEAQIEANLAMENLRQVYNGTPALLFTMRFDGKILSVSDYWLRETGYAVNDVIGTSLNTLLSEHSGQQLTDTVLPALQTHSQVRDVPLCLIYSDGREVDVMLSIDSDLRQSSEAMTYVCVMNDVSLLRRAEQKLHHQALTDHLTGLPNRRGLIDYFEDIKAGKYPDINHCAIMFVDLDNFKIVNDTHGHQVGDAILRVSAAKIHKVIGPHAMIARIGGDEFAIILGAKTKHDNIENISKKLVEELSKPIIFDDISCTVGASVGIAMSKDFPNDLSETLRLSDQAMYLAKSSGKNQACIYDDISAEDIQIRARCIQLVQNGVRDDAFEIYFQPIISLDHMRPIAFEALLRVSAEADQPNTIAGLIRLAEETGQMEALGNWIFERSVSDFQSLLDHFPKSQISLTINLSAQQLTAPFVTRVIAHMAHYPDMSGKLIFEITETAAIDRFDEVCNLLKQLRGAGIRIALDNFGSGYSSLWHITQLPIDILKLDMSFVQTSAASGPQMDRSDPHVILVRSLAAMAKDLGLTVVAEGVETLETMENYHQLGVQFGQGHLFSRALKLSDAKLWMAPYSATKPGTSWKNVRHAN